MMLLINHYDQRIFFIFFLLCIVLACFQSCERAKMLHKNSLVRWPTLLAGLGVAEQGGTWGAWTMGELCDEFNLVL